MIVMAIVAHPTDAFDMVGGTLANHVERGDTAHVCFTHARMHEDAFRLADRIRTGQADADEAAIQAESERHIDTVRDACAILGIEQISTIDYTGEVMVFSADLVGRAATRVQEVRPDLLITHNPLENAGVTPHAVCGQVVIEAMRLAGGARANGLEPHQVAQLFFICPSGDTTWTDWVATNRYPAIQIDVTRQVEKKVKALAKLTAQHYTLQMAAKVVEATSGLNAVHRKVTYAEHFQPHFPEVYEHLPVSDHNLRLARELYEQGARRLRLIAPYVEGVRD